MAITRRTQKEIEKDCKKIREAAKTATSIKDIERTTNLSYAEIITTMSRHPRIFKRIKEQLLINKNQAELEKAIRKEQTASTDKEKKTNISKRKTNPENDTSKKIPECFVIDASITGIQSLMDTLSKLCAEKSKIILTSVTIKELENMQKFDDIKALHARYILALAAENSDIFDTVLIDETLDTPDDGIIQYCAKNEDHIILLTSDKTMALKARMYNVQVHYLKQDKQTNKLKSQIMTLHSAKKIANKLLISEFQTYKKSISVFSNGLEYTEGSRELNIGDDVYISTQKIDYITFAHYRIISLSAENNCKLVFSKRIYDCKDINLLPKASYKSFIKDFMRRHDL